MDDFFIDTILSAVFIFILYWFIRFLNTRVSSETKFAFTPFLNGSRYVRVKGKYGVIISRDASYAIIEFDQTNEIKIPYYIHDPLLESVSEEEFNVAEIIES